MIFSVKIFTGNIQCLFFNTTTSFLAVSNMTWYLYIFRQNWWYLYLSTKIIPRQLQYQVILFFFFYVSIVACAFMLDYICIFVWRFRPWISPLHTVPSPLLFCCFSRSIIPWSKSLLFSFFFILNYCIYAYSFCFYACSCLLFLWLLLVVGFLLVNVWPVRIRVRIDCVS
jgi:hypothetical protein